MAQHNGGPTAAALSGEWPASAERRRPGGVDPPHLWPAYLSTVERAPSRPAVRLPYGPGELTGPRWAAALAAGGRGPGLTADLTRDQPQGERIVVAGRVVDAAGQPLPEVLVEVWQTNAAGRYAHDRDRHDAPLDPHFTGAGACLTDAQGGFRFVTIKPGAYPWRNHANAWRPAHIHFSVLGRAFSQRLITQMYFPGDPLLAHDPIFNSVAEVAARERLIARFDLALTVPEWALGYRFDIALGGREATP
jgi:protocatechuate 3,4-dioxygenase beta subunit